ncbi:MAG: DUF938 domain-containing protein [Granulosicoccus sp.]
MLNPKPCAPAAERNKQAILLRLQGILRPNDTVFEFGSGTGQHACHISSALPEVIWQPSDLEDKLAGIRQWIAESGCHNINQPLQLDLKKPVLPEFKASICFSANTLHIISWPLVEVLFEISSTMLGHSGKLCIYGPFSFDGRYTSDNNEQFDKQLRASDPDSGIRDVVALQDLAHSNGFSYATVFDMPANNHLLVWNRDTL